MVSFVYRMGFPATRKKERRHDCFVSGARAVNFRKEGDAQ